MNLFEDFGCGNFALPLETYSLHWGITENDDRCRFLAQLSVESAKFTRLVENLNYRPQRLLEKFQGRNGLQTLEQATLICAGGHDRIAQAVYGLPWGKDHLGNESQQDAIDFIGRGLIMLTGRTNYRDASYGCFGDDRLLRNPTMLSEVTVAANVACWFWYNRHLSSLTDVTEITRKVNGGLTALKERIEETKRAMGLIAREALVN